MLLRKNCPCDESPQPLLGVRLAPKVTDRSSGLARRYSKVLRYRPWYEFLAELLIEKMTWL
jgi:hypothetical protein